ncbi:uncharacterized protein LOC124285568 [Haliotis rubra]|uniref:uncharacterized protein LOC124285568 n=1 Tax=Haliotis rubra TaxID=36100 RepID=UPI001EE4FAAB|nr:uncharacterized protein LOC124285568 [Haliotis rubra]
MKMQVVIGFAVLYLVSMVTSNMIVPLNLNLDPYALIRYTVNDDGCSVNGASKDLDSDFTLDVTGNCVKYRCAADGVSVVTDQSGCMGDNGCVNGLTPYGCDAFTCPNDGNSMNGKTHVWLIDEDAEEQCEILGDNNCYDLHEWHTVNGMKCKCDTRFDMNCQLGMPSK